MTLGKPEILTDIDNLQSTVATHSSQLEENKSYSHDKDLYTSTKFYPTWADLLLSSSEYNSTLAQKNIVYIGDSLFGYKQQYMPLVLRNSGQLNGFGFDKFLRYNGTSLQTMTGFTKYEDTTANSELKWGFCGASFKGVTGSTLSYKVASMEIVKNLDLYYAKETTGGTFRYNINGGAWTTVDTTDTELNLGILKLTNFSNGIFNLEVLSGEVWLYGVCAWNDDRGGILPFLISEGGSTLAQWSTYSVLLKKFLVAVNPKQVYVWLGQNDALVSSKATYKANYNTLVANIRTSINNATDIIGFSTTPDHNSSTANANTEIFREAMFELWKEINISFFDLRNKWGTAQESYDNGMYADGLHPSDKAGLYNWILITQICMPPFTTRYVSKDYLTTLKMGLGFANNSKIALTDSNGNLNDNKFVFGADSLEFLLTTLSVLQINKDGYTFNVRTTPTSTTPFAINKILKFLSSGTDMGIINAPSYVNLQSNSVDKLRIRPESVRADVPFQVPTYTSATLSSAHKQPGYSAYYDDGTNKYPIHCDGTYWRKYSDNTIVS